MHRTTTIILAFLLAATALAQSRAWRDLTFGMPQTDYRALLETYEDVEFGPLGMSTHVTLGTNTYRLWSQWPDGHLGRIWFDSPPLTATSFDTTLQTYLRELAEIITTATGTEPKRHHPSFFSVNEGVTWTHEWPIGEDGVLRRIGISMSGFEYRATLWVEDVARMRAWEASRRQAGEDARREAADDF